MRRSGSRVGFTLIELVVTCLLIGILASFALPQYLRAVEVGKADDAVGLVNMIGTTNKMFALDHAGSYVTGTFSSACGAGPCGTPYTNACVLVWCKYLADQDWENKYYTFTACNGGACGAGSGYAAADRKSAPPELAASPPYNTWRFWMQTTGVISAYGTSVPAPTY